ncbi:MAG: cation-translocating P-type ATPase [Alphaproteobacteria bacterium]|nr:cation-translocating P-type ATPase [Alphaproteobacteria bacterium]
MNNVEENGLTEQEAAHRLAAEGPNEVPAQGQRDALTILFGVLSEPMFALLLVAAGIYFILGEGSEAIALSLFATFSVSIALIQEWRSERVLTALRDLTSPRALVIRDGHQRRIPGREVVRGDVVVLVEGDRVPADAWIVSGHDLSADESLLTGESAPVRKAAEPDLKPCALRPGGDDLPAVYSGSLLVRGHGRAVVTATGTASEIGKIGSALGAIRTETPRLQNETREIVRIAAIAGLAVSFTVAIAYGLSRQSWLEGLLSGIAVGMSLLPEEFPLVLAVFMVMGAWRIAQAKVLTRRAASIESLGAVTVLCTDKTGTLTQNKMELVHAETATEFWDRDSKGLTPSVRELLETAVLAGLPDPFDPMERALQGTWQQQAAGLDTVFDPRELLEHRGISAERLAMTQVWRDRRTGATMSAVKGAPEAVVRMCALPAAVAGKLLARTAELATRGLRVLAIADSVDGEAFRYLGLVGFEDPLRESARGAIIECREAGIRVIMITGDYPQTARAIAAQAGIETIDVLSGTDLERLDDAALSERVKTCQVFARILPEQKLRIVEALKANGEIVGMTGDGVNDAPSLRAAHIGIAMGGRGTDVAREASSIVLLDDDFGSIVKTIRLGRRIYDNLRKAMGYILSVHVPIAGLALLPLGLGGPLILTPALIALLEMIIDPACSVAFEAEAEESNVMKRPPRNPQSRLLDRRLLISGLALGAAALITVAAVFLIGKARGGSLEDLRTLVLVSLVTTNVGLIFAHRSFDGSLTQAFGRPNRWLWTGIAGIAAVLAVLEATPAMRDAFGLAPMHADDLILSVAAAVAFLAATWMLRTLVFRAPPDSAR